MSSSSMRMPVWGTMVAALSTKVLPAVMHTGMNQPNGIMAGKL